MQALRLLTNFGSFRKKILIMTQNSKKQITQFVSFGYSPELSRTETPWHLTGGHRWSRAFSPMDHRWSTDARRHFLT